MRQAKKSRKRISKETLLFKFAQYFFKSTFEYEDAHICINTISIFLIELIHSLQYIGIIIFQFTTLYNEQQQQSQQGPLQIVLTLCKMARPYLFLNPTNFKLLYLIPLLSLLLIVLTIMIQFTLQHYQNKHKQKSQIKKFGNKFIQELISYYVILYLSIFQIPFLEITFKGFYLSIQTTRIASMIFSFITILTVFLFNLFCLLLQESVSIKIKNNHLLNQTSIEYWNSFILIVIVLNDILDIDKNSKFYLLFALMLLKSILKIINSYRNYPTLQLYCLLKLFFDLANVFLILLLFFIIVSNLNGSQRQILIVFLIYPLIYQIAIKIFNSFHYRVLLDKQMKEECEEIQYRLSNLLEIYVNLNQNYEKNSQIICYIHNYYSYHKDICDNPKCVCNNNPHITLEEMIKTYLKDQVKYFSFQISQLNDQSAKFSYFLHYLSLVSYLGMNTNAFQQSSMMVYEDSQVTSNIGSLMGKTIVERKVSSQSNEQKSSSQQKSRKESQRDRFPQMKFGDLSYLQFLKLNLIQDMIKQSMNLNLQKNVDQTMQDSLSHAVKLFLEAEQNNMILKKKVMKMINRKKEFFGHFTEQSRKFNLFSESKNLLIQVEDLENKLQKMYNQFPSQKMQALNTFFQAEIRNNYFNAFKLANVTSISDEKLMKMQASTSFDLFSSNVVYLVIGFDEQSHKLTIRSCSNLVHEFFNVTQEQFKLLTSIDPLLPQNFSSIHSKIVQIFLQTGQSKFFREIGLSFCSQNLEFIKPINFFFEINQTSIEDLNFICFLQNYDVQSAYIFVNSNYRIISHTKNLAYKLGYQQKHFQTFNKSFIKQSILKIITNFQEFLQQQELSLHNMKYLKAKSLNGLSMLLPTQIALEEGLQINWDHMGQLSVYNIEGQINIRYHDSEILYFIIEIRDARVNQTTQGTQKSFSQYYLTSEDLQDLDDLSQQILDEDMVQFPNQIQRVNQDYNLNNDLYECDHFGVKMEIGEITQTPQINQNQSNSYLNANQSLFSPKNVGLQLLSNDQSSRNMNQKFFNSQLQKQDFSDSQEQTNKIDDKYNVENQIDQLQMEDIDDELQENIKLQMQLEKYDNKIVHIDDIGSQVSSIAGIKKSKYFKKYEIIEKMISSNKFSLKFNISLMFIYLMILLSSGIQLGTTLNGQSDLSRFLQELDMVQIRSNLIGPVDKFIVCQNAILQYIILSQYYFVYSLDIAIQKMQYSQSDVGNSYNTLKINFDNQLANPYLDPFFQNKYIVVNQGNYPKLDQYNITVREALYLQKEACYKQTLVNFFEIFTFDLTSTFLVYLYSNYQPLNEMFKTLNQEMLVYSVNRSYSVSRSWYSIMIPGLIISALLLIISYGYYRTYLKQYERIMQLFTQIDHVWVQRDVDRYRGILTLLNKDSNVLFKYQFDIDLKEKFLAAEDFRKEKIALNQRSSKIKQKNSEYSVVTNINLIPSIMAFSLLYMLYFSFSFLSNIIAQDYFTKYPQTTNFFNTLSDLSVASSGVFAMREIIYQINTIPQVYYFFDSTDADYFTEIFFQDIQKINDFIILVNSFDSNKYITTTGFVDQLQLLLTSDVCNFLPDDKKQLAQSHCDSLFDGVLRRGYQETLIKVRDTLLNEYNNQGGFILKVYSTNEELETGLIGYDVVNQLRSQFQHELIYFTEDLIYYIMVISIIYIILIYIILICIQKIVRDYYKWEFKIVKQFILLLPQTSLFLDSQLDRQIRQMIIKDDLI